MPYFICGNCGKKVFLKAPGTKNRNHCPYCLYSLHVDQRTGDRNSRCKGMMEPVGKLLKKDGEEVIIHKCLICGQLRKNRVAGDDNYRLVNSLKIVDLGNLAL